jgi:hypothetical protein
MNNPIGESRVGLKKGGGFLSCNANFVGGRGNVWLGCLGYGKTANDHAVKEKSFIFFPRPLDPPMNYAVKHCT